MMTETTVYTHSIPNATEKDVLALAEKVFGSYPFDIMGELFWEYGHYLGLMEKGKNGGGAEEVLPGSFWRQITSAKLQDYLTKASELFLFDSMSQIHILADGEGNYRCVAVSEQVINGGEPCSLSKAEMELMPTSDNGKFSYAAKTGALQTPSGAEKLVAIQYRKDNQVIMQRLVRKGGTS